MLAIVVTYWSVIKLAVGYALGVKVGLSTRQFNTDKFEIDFVLGVTE